MKSTKYRLTASKWALNFLRFTSRLLILSMTSSLLTHWATSVLGTNNSSSFLGAPSLACPLRESSGAFIAAARCMLHNVPILSFALPADGEPLAGVVLL